MWRTKRKGVAVFPRQSGKDVAMSMETCDGLLRTPKTTAAYVSLNNPMVRDILWDKSYLDPETGDFIMCLMDNVPKDLVDWKNTFMEGRFRNKSKLKVQGYFQSGQDKSGVGTSFQTYAFTELALFSREDPLPRLMPIIDNDNEPKRLMVASTPRGKRRNPLWQLMESHKGDPDFQVIVRTIDDLNAMMKREGLPPVRSELQLEKTRDAYLKRFGNDRMFEQEYYCSFEEMDAAAVYGEAYMKMLEEKRIHDFNLDPGRPVFVVFDIGASGQQSDATSWIAFQWFNNRLFIYDCGEGHGKALPEYVDILRTKHYFNRIEQIILPWDGEHHEKAVNTTPADMMKLKFSNVAVLAKSNKVWKIPNSRNQWGDVITDIQATRLALYNTVINATNCQWLLECLENYKYEFNNKEQQWSAKPLHDKHSHMMDALRYAVQATKEIEFFGGNFFDSSNGAPASTDYEQDYSGVWRR
jgi:hypothetical protein